MPADALRRSPSSHAAILEAAWELACEVGHARLTVEAIAKRAGVGKQTIYRWWPTKEAILLEELDSRTSATLEFQNSGDIRADLRRQLTEVTKVLGSDGYAPYRGLIAAAQSDEELSRKIHDRIIEPRVTALVSRVSQAQSEGQLRRDIAARDVVELLYGPIYYRLLLRTRPLRVADTRRHLDLVLEGLTPRG
jgi:AcrR family transcriptional regulator